MNRIYNTHVQQAHMRAHLVCLFVAAPLDPLRQRTSAQRGETLHVTRNEHFRPTTLTKEVLLQKYI